MDYPPRFLRAKDAPRYLGVNRNYFDKEIRPYVTEVRLGPQMVCFDRLDLDRWADDIKARNGRPGRAMKGGNEPWDAKQRQDSPSGAKSGTSKKSYADRELDKALEQVLSKKRSGS